MPEEEYGSELVVRPDTIVYLACSLANTLSGFLFGSFQRKPDIVDWTDQRQVIPHLELILNTLNNISELVDFDQNPFLLQPIWKTVGKSPVLAENCLDVFVWSDVALVKLICEISQKESRTSKITRQTRH